MHLVFVSGDKYWFMTFLNLYSTMLVYPQRLHLDLFDAWVDMVDGRESEVKECINHYVYIGLQH